MQRRAQPAVGEDARVDAGGELAQVAEPCLDVVARPIEKAQGLVRRVGQPVLGKPEAQRG